MVRTGDDIGIGDDTEESLLVSALEVIHYKALSNSTESIGGLFATLGVGGGGGGGVLIYCMP